MVGSLLDRVDIPPSSMVTKDSPEMTLIIDGIHLSSAYNRRREAELQATLVPNTSDRAWVYGIGSGDLPRVLLRRKRLKNLTVVILNPGVALASFTHIDHEDWLNDPRVELLTGDEKDLCTPFAASPACLQLADESSARLRDLVFLELSTPYSHKKHAHDNPEVQDRIRANEPLIKNDGDVATLFDSQPGATVMVALAGPSLGKNLDKIAARRGQYPLIAVNSALKPLAQAGIIPDVAMVIDDDPKIISCFRGYDQTAFEHVPLIYFPRVPGSVLSIWPGPRLAAYSDHPCYRGVCRKLPRGKLFASGSVLHTAVDLAVRMGANEVILLGADLAFPGGQKYAPGAGWNEVDTASAKHWVLDGHGNRVSTLASFRGYLRDLETYIEKHPQVSFFNSSLDGASIKGTTIWQDAL